MALSDTAIKRSVASDKEYKLSDAGGLYLLVKPSGGKLWRWKYRFVGTEKLMRSRDHAFSNIFCELYGLLKM